MWLHLERQILFKSTIYVVLFLVLAQLCFIKFTSANPYDPHMFDHVEVSPLSFPKIAVLSPVENNSLVNSNNLTISLKANITEAFLGDIYYEPSWLSNNFTVFPDENNIFLFRGEDYEVHEYSGNLFFTGIPEGIQTVTITVEGNGDYTRTVSIPQEYPWDPSTGIVCYYWESYVVYTVGFVVDTVSPQVLVLDNKTFSMSEVPLDFIVNEVTSKIAYSLDGQERVLIAGNTTLAGLFSGAHSLKVYVTDEAGNVGSSETIIFSIVLFPIEVVMVSIILVTALFAVFLLAWRKHKH